MVRMRRERWYSRENQQKLWRRSRNESGSMRRFISLIILLAMVTVLMKQLSNPATIDNAFQQLGAPLASAPDRPSVIPILPSNLENANLERGNSEEAIASENTEQGQEENSREPQSTAPIWTYCFQKGNPSLLREFTDHLLVTKPSNDHFASGITDWIRLVEESVEWNPEWNADSNAPQLQPQSSEDEKKLTANELQFQKWIVQWKRMRNWCKEGQPELTSFDEESLASIRTGLEEALIQNISDATPWRPSERGALFLCLDRIASGKGKKGATLPLVHPVVFADQTKQYRAEWVRMRGTIEESPTPSKIKDEYFGEQEFHVVWLRSSDDSTQPLCVYLTQLPELAPNTTLEKGSMIEFEGMFLKRLAYASKRGIDTAPLIIAGAVQSISYEQSQSNPVRGVAMTMNKQVWKPLNPNAAAWNRLSELIASPVASLLKDATATELLRSDAPTASRELLQILFQLRRSPHLLEKAADDQRTISGTLTLTRPGIVTAVTPVELSKEDADWFEAPTIYRLTIKPYPLAASGESSEAVVEPTYWTAIVADIPDLWKSASKINQPVVLSGISIENSRSDTNSTSITLCGRVQWRCDADQQHRSQVTVFEPPLNDSWRALVIGGWDLSNLDLLRKLQKKPMASEELLGFHSLMQWCQAIPQNDRETLSRTASNITDILKSANDRQLQPARFVFKVVRATRIQVESDDARQALGADSYYELDGFGEIGKTAIRFHTTPNDPNPLVFQGEFPVTVVCRELPKELLNDGYLANTSIPMQSDKEWNATVHYPKKQIQVEGLFYRFWEYSTGRSETATQSQRPQIAPLVFAYASSSSPYETPKDQPRSNMISSLFLFAILGVSYIAFRLSMNTRKRANHNPKR